MNNAALLVILAFGIAFGYCLRDGLTAARRWLRRKWHKPSLLHLDTRPWPTSDTEVVRVSQTSPDSEASKKAFNTQLNQPQNLLNPSRKM
jgi:hypothetical protein